MNSVQTIAEPTSGYVAVADGLVKEFGNGAMRVRAVDGVSFQLPRGQMIALRGPSGCGKSSLLNMLGALDRPDDGDLTVDGINVNRMSGGEEVRYRRTKVGFVFQQFNLVPQYKALENVMLPMDLAARWKAAERPTRAADLLRQVGLTPEKHLRRPAHLSGGEQQRVAIARALANDPAIVLADEPTANLDSRTGQVIIELLHSLRMEDRTIIIATHDASIAANADIVLEMSDGRIPERYERRRTCRPDRTRDDNGHTTDTTCAPATSTRGGAGR